MANLWKETECSWISVLATHLFPPKTWTPPPRARTLLQSQSGLLYGKANSISRPLAAQTLRPYYFGRIFRLPLNDSEAALACSEDIIRPECACRGRLHPILWRYGSRAVQVVSCISCSARYSLVDQRRDGVGPDWVAGGDDIYFLRACGDAWRSRGIQEVQSHLNAPSRQFISESGVFRISPELSLLFVISGLDPAQPLFYTAP